MSIDQDNSKSLSFEEIVNGCSKIHASYILHKLRKTIESGKELSIDKVFSAVDEDNNDEMDITEFSTMVDLCYKGLKKHEIDTLFQHFD